MMFRLLLTEHKVVAEKMPSGHIMDFGDGEFEIKVQNNGKIVHNMKELLFEIGDYV